MRSRGKEKLPVRLRERITAILAAVLLAAAAIGPATAEAKTAAERETAVSENAETAADAELSEMLAAEIADAEDGPETVAFVPEPADPEGQRTTVTNEKRMQYIGQLLSRIGCGYPTDEETSAGSRGFGLKSKKFDCSGLVANVFMTIGYSRHFSTSKDHWVSVVNLPEKFSGWEWMPWTSRPGDTKGVYDRVKDGQKLYLIPDSRKDPVLTFVVRKGKFTYENSRAAGSILVKMDGKGENGWHVTTVLGYYDATWLKENAGVGNVSKETASKYGEIKRAVMDDIVAKYGSYLVRDFKGHVSLFRNYLTHAHRGRANGKLGTKSGWNDSFYTASGVDGHDYPVMWDLRQRKGIKTKRVYNPVWQIDSLNPAVGVSINNSNIGRSTESTIGMRLDWETFGDCYLDVTDDTSEYGCASAPLAGVKYGIFRDSDCRKLIADGETDENGRLVFTDLDTDAGKPVTYYVKALAAPEGYAFTDTIYPVTVRAGENTRVSEGTFVDPCTYTGEFTLSAAVNTPYGEDWTFCYTLTGELWGGRTIRREIAVTMEAGATWAEVTLTGVPMTVDGTYVVTETTDDFVSSPRETEGFPWEFKDCATVTVPAIGGARGTVLMPHIYIPPYVPEPHIGVERTAPPCTELDGAEMGMMDQIRPTAVRIP